MSTDPAVTAAPGPIAVIGAGFGSPPLGLVQKVEEVDPKAELVLGSAGYSYAPRGGLILSQAADEVLVRFGPRAYEMMLCDDAVGAAVDFKKIGMLGSGMRLQPRHRIDPGQEVDDPELAAKVERSEHWRAFCERAWQRLGPDVGHALLWQALDMVALRQVAAEHVLEEVAEGEDAGTYQWKSLNVKHRLNWALVVDSFMNVLGLHVRTPEGPRVAPRKKFAVFTWHPRSGDPRGWSDLRRAYVPWNLKAQRPEQRAKHTHQFGTASVVIKYNPNAAPIPQLDAAGNPDYTKPPVAPDQVARQAIASFAAGSYLIVPSNWEVDVLDARADGGAFTAADADDNRAIARAILLADRATNEAKNGSKADSETSADVVLMGMREGSAYFARLVERELFHRLIEFNAGTEEADLYTPEVSFPMPQQLQAPLWTAVASLLTTGKVPDGTVPRLFEAAGLPVPTAEELEAQKEKEQEAERQKQELLQQQQQQQQQGQDATTPGKAPADDPAPPKPKKAEPDEAK